MPLTLSPDRGSLILRVWNGCGLSFTSHYFVHAGGIASALALLFALLLWLGPQGQPPVKPMCTTHTCIHTYMNLKSSATNKVLSPEYKLMCRGVQFALLLALEVVFRAASEFCA